MKLRDFLQVVDKNQFICLGISVCGMQFETKHTAEFYLNNGDDLNNREIMKIYTTDDGLHVRLNDQEGGYKDMRFDNYGYKEEKIKVRKMSMAELRLGIVQELLKKNYRYVNIKLVNTTCGDVDSFRSTEDFLMAEYNECYEIELLSVKEILYYEEAEKCSKIRIVILIRDIL